MEEGGKGMRGRKRGGHVRRGGREGEGREEGTITGMESVSTDNVLCQIPCCLV